MKNNLFTRAAQMSLIICAALILNPEEINAQSIPQQYREPFASSFPIRKDQHLEIKAYVDKLLHEEIEKALTSFKPDFLSVDDYVNSLYPYRKQVGEFFGYPPPKSIDGKITEFIKVGEDVYCTIYRVWIEVVEGVNAYGIYMVPKNLNTKAPLIIAQHGGGGNPEAICDLDTRINYHSFGPEAVKRGYIVWAPALAMNCGFCEDPQIPGASREQLDRKLKLAGTSIIGLEIHKIIESTRTLIRERPEIDANRVGMTGLSWGGFFTMYTAAVCPFIKVAINSANFRDFEAELHGTLTDEPKRVPDRYSFQGLGNFQAVGLICPRPCMIQMGEKDILFDMDGALKESARAAQFYEKLGIGDLYEFHVHPEGHEFDITGIFRFFDKHL